MFLGAGARAGAGSEQKIPESENTQIWTSPKSCSATFNNKKLKQMIIFINNSFLQLYFFTTHF